MNVLPQLGYGEEKTEEIDIFSFRFSYIGLEFGIIWYTKPNRNKRKEMEQDEIQKMCCCRSAGTVPGGGRSSERLAGQ